VTRIAFAPDGRTLAALDNETILWTIGALIDTRAHAVELACRYVGDLDRQQWREYAPGLPYQHSCPAT
jgi:hypothetical protein